MSDIMEKDARYVAHTYGRYPVAVASGKGSFVWDENGKEYIDMGSGIGVTAFGIADDAWVAAVEKQLHQVQHMSNLYYTRPCVQLAELLCEKTGMKRVFFGNSGAEANECAIKAARKWAAQEKGSEYNVIVTLRNSFHGRTLTTLAATGQEHYHELFQPLTPGFAYAEPNDAVDLERILRENACAGILIECIQGEGGVRVMTEEYLQEAQRLAQKYNVLLMVDEVQTGNGRTGKLYAYMHAGIRPDVVSTAKGLGGGLPLGACLLGERVQDIFAPGDHGSTFGGNPIACAGAVSIVERLTDALMDEVAEKSRLVFSMASGARGVAGVYGKGLMIGLEPKYRPAGEIVRALVDRGVLCLTAKDRVRLLPALNIPTPLLERAVSVILDEMAKEA